MEQRLRVCGRAAALRCRAARTAAAAQTRHHCDIQRLQDRCTRRATTCRGCAAATATLADDLQNELDDLRDEVVYLKVKMRKKARQPQRLQRRARPGSRTCRVAPGSDAGTSVWHANTANSTAGATTGSGSTGDTRSSDSRMAAVRQTPHRATAGHQRSRRATSDPGRPGDRRAPRAGAELRHRAGRGSLRGDDGRRPVSGQRRADSRRARRCAAWSARSTRRRAPSARAA